MDITPIRSEEGYNQTLKRIDHLMDAESGTPRGDELDILVMLVEVYEKG
ncbi:MAG: hypothetical protein IIB71_16625 [Proteobacteria bacterium]|nr:hypothetical protein [Pseudomonadota bacterium]